MSLTIVKQKGEDRRRKMVKEELIIQNDNNNCLIAHKIFTQKELKTEGKQINLGKFVFMR